MSNLTKTTIAFVADFFADEIPGGGEVNNDELIKLLSADYRMLKVKSRNLDPVAIEYGLVDYYIISNFVQLGQRCRDALTNKARYIIYEHDHKYVRNRNPAAYENYLAPKSEIVNFDYYKNAAAVFCQSDFHANIVRKNLELDNIHSVGGNLWSEDTLMLMRGIAQSKKRDVCSIVQTDNWHKNTVGAVRYCNAKGLQHELIGYTEIGQFLTKLGSNKRLVFFPQTPETLSRIVVEARMMGMSVVTNRNVGATKEPWFDLKGEPLVDLMVEKRIEIPEAVKRVLNG